MDHKSTRNKPLPTLVGTLEEEKPKEVRKPQAKKTETFARERKKVKESRERLWQFIVMAGEDRLYSPILWKDLTLPCLQHIQGRPNREILSLADKSIEKMQNSGRTRQKWSYEDTAILVWVLDMYKKPPHQFEDEDWRQVAALIPGKNHEEAMFKWLNIRKIFKNKAWKLFEDFLLKQIVEGRRQKGSGKVSWVEVSKQHYYQYGKGLNLFRRPKHCYERWKCFLNQTVKKGPWKIEEQVELLKYVLQKGPKWVWIARKLYRTQNGTKNKFNNIFQKYKKRLNSNLSDQEYISRAILQLTTKLLLSGPSRPYEGEEEDMNNDGEDGKIGATEIPIKQTCNNTKSLLEPSDVKAEVEEEAGLEQEYVDVEVLLSENEEPNSDDEVMAELNQLFHPPAEWASHQNSFKYFLD